jgi:hypothetical protein
MPAEPFSDDVKSVSLEVVRDEPRKKLGRPTTLTVRLFIKICHLVEQGMAISRACEAWCLFWQVPDSRIAQRSVTRTIETS